MSPVTSPPPTERKLTPADWQVVSQSFPEALAAIRKAPPFDQLTVAPWAVLTQMMMGWARGQPPGLVELAAGSGCSERSVRRTVGDLKAEAIVLPVRDNGAGVNVLPGPQLASRLVDFAAGREVAHLATGQSDHSFKLKKINELTSSSFSERGPELATLATPASTVDDRRATACRALSAWFRKAHPSEPEPVRFRSFDLDTVVACLAPETGDPAALDQMNLDAIAGALARSKGRPPTVSFIWRHRGHFLAHVDHGRSLRQADPPRPRRKRPPPEDPPASHAFVVEELGKLLAILDAIPRDPPLRGPNPFLPPSPALPSPPPPQSPTLHDRSPSCLA